jgi:hypothetical protein
MQNTRHPNVAKLVQAVAAKLSPGTPHSGENLCRSLALLSFAAIAAAEETGEATLQGILDRLTLSALASARNLHDDDGLRVQFARAYMALLPTTDDTSTRKQTMLDLHGINMMEVIQAVHAAQNEIQGATK